MDLIRLNIPAAIFDNQFISLHLQLLKEDLDTRTDIFEEVFLNVSCLAHRVNFCNLFIIAYNNIQINNCKNIQICFENFD